MSVLSVGSNTHATPEVFFGKRLGEAIGEFLVPRGCIIFVREARRVSVANEFQAIFDRRNPGVSPHACPHWSRKVRNRFPTLHLDRHSSRLGLFVCKRSAGESDGVVLPVRIVDGAVCRIISGRWHRGNNLAVKNLYAEKCCDEVAQAGEPRLATTFGEEHDRKAGKEKLISSDEI